MGGFPPQGYARAGLTSMTREPIVDDSVNADGMSRQFLRLQQIN
ncbi:unnamed protein product [marine sediment metagenome]|uniref:Uncharacterized protein n=1 Tax=marine sediment metagenome TaxID=412755 RepID=X1J3Q9_9ZZZZ